MSVNPEVVRERRALTTRELIHIELERIDTASSIAQAAQKELELQKLRVNEFIKKWLGEEVKRVVGSQNGYVQIYAFKENHPQDLLGLDLAELGDLLGMEYYPDLGHVEKEEWHCTIDTSGEINLVVETFSGEESATLSPVEHRNAVVGIALALEAFSKHPAKFRSSETVGGEPKGLKLWLVEGAVL